jgi:hypothetical protein
LRKTSLLIIIHHARSEELMADEPLRIASSKPTDMEIAKEIKDKVRVALEPLLGLSEEARRHGFVLRYQTGINGGTGREVIVDVHLERHF